MIEPNDLIVSVTTEYFDASIGEVPPQRDVFVRLADGKIIQISPAFNAINVWMSQEELYAWNLGINGNLTLTLDMGGEP